MLSILFVAVLCQADPLTDIADLRADVVALKVSGQIKVSYATLLINVLDSARARVVNGQIPQAIALMKAFNTYVARFVVLGELSAANGQMLTDQADAIILLLQ